MCPFIRYDADRGSPSLNQLDDLSTALKAFHALPTPILDLATSRANTTSSASSKISSSPPHTLYFGQPSSPLPSFPPPHVGTSFSRPHATFSPAAPSSPPPVLPLPTLAIPSSTVGLSIPAGPGPATTPVLPRAISSKILVDAQHVDSPVDMHPTQSIFSGGGG
jgi:hypothetical protein